MKKFIAASIIMIFTLLSSASFAQSGKAILAKYMAKPVMLQVKFFDMASHKPGFPSKYCQLRNIFKFQSNQRTLKIQDNTQIDINVVKLSFNGLYVHIEGQGVWSGISADNQQPFKDPSVFKGIGLTTGRYITGAYYDNYCHGYFTASKV